MTKVTNLADKNFTAFLVRPWHNSKASLYPPVMDGVEYIDDAIRTIKQVLGKAEFEVRVDEDVFVPGFTIRENLQREIFNADLVVVLLDGLRPNVVYELGFAYGWHQLEMTFDRDTDRAVSDVPRIVCFAEQNATVLARNMYPDPMAIPTVDGGTAKILNPKLDLSRIFSDNSDLLIAYYDRLNLQSSIERSLRRFVEAYSGSKSKQELVRTALDETPEPEIVDAQDGWKLYSAGKHSEVVNLFENAKEFSERKVLALSLMKLGRLFEAIEIWKQLLPEARSSSKAGVLYHLGICHYVVKQKYIAENYFSRAKDEGDLRGERYLRKLRREPDGEATEVSPQPEEPQPTPSSKVKDK